MTLHLPRVRARACTGLAWPAVPGGGPAGALPPHSWKILFNEGGMGTMYPLFYALLQRAHRHEAAARQQPPPPQQQQQQHWQQPNLAQAQQEVGELQRKVRTDARVHARVRWLGRTLCRVEPGMRRC